MTALRTAIDQVRQRISQHKGSRRLNEQNTKGALIEPVLRALGWDVEDPDVVTREYKGKRPDRPVDYALRVLRSPKLFVEAKALGENLSDRKWAGQVIGYASVAGVKWAVLTDGNEYRVYNTHAPVDVEGKLFRTVCVATSPDVELMETLSLLSQDQLTENRIEALWSIHFVDQEVRRALVDLFGPAPDPAVVRLLKRHTTGLSSQELRTSLTRLRIENDAPLVSTRLDAAAPERPGARSVQQRFAKRTRGTDGKTLELADLIALGVVTVPLPIQARYKGRIVQGVIEADGRISMQSERYESLSQAAAVARQRINGAQKPPATNGWRFWKVLSRDGKQESLHAVRARAASSVPK